jgi:hypothetical protein
LVLRVLNEKLMQYRDMCSSAGVGKGSSGSSSGSGSSGGSSSGSGIGSSGSSSGSGGSGSRGSRLAPFTAQGVGNSFSGLQSMSTADSPSVAETLGLLADVAESSCEVMRPRDVGNALFGMQVRVCVCVCVCMYVCLSVFYLTLIHFLLSCFYITPTPPLITMSYVPLHRHVSQ